MGNFWNEIKFFLSISIDETFSTKKALRGAHVSIYDFINERRVLVESKKDLSISEISREKGENNNS